MTEKTVTIPLVIETGMEFYIGAASYSVIERYNSNSRQAFRCRGPRGIVDFSLDQIVHQATSFSENDVTRKLIEEIKKKTDYVRHYMHMHTGKPARGYETAPEIALDNILDAKLK
jgi:hypothetical protein